jgi:hypothetical protein
MQRDAVAYNFSFIADVECDAMCFGRVGELWSHIKNSCSVFELDELRGSKQTFRDNLENDKGDMGG